MTDAFPYPPEGSPEALVRQHLDARARAEAGDAVVDRAFARLESEAERPVLARGGAGRWRPALAAALVAACLFVGSLFLFQPRAFATPAQLVEATLQASDPEMDRCYHLQVQRLDDQNQPFGRLLRESHLWTRGDRYRIDLLGIEGGSMGQDEDRRIWLAPTPRQGAIFDHDEVPEKLALLSDLRTLRLDLLLRELTRGFLLEWDDVHDGAENLRRIRAVPKPGKNVQGILCVTLDVQPAGKIVERLTVDRMRPLTGKVRVSLERIENRPQTSDFYHLEGALEATGERFSRTRGPQNRTRVLLETLRRFGLPLGG